MSQCRFTLQGKPASIAFKSRYHDENDYIVTCGERSGRVRRYDDGRIVSCSSEFSDDEAALAIAVHQEAEEEEYQRWREANAALFA